MSDQALTREQARSYFDAALDGELSTGEQARFEAALLADEELHAEFSRQRALREATKQLGAAVPKVDLLAGVQHKLRARSGGKFYRDRFAERRGRQPSLALALFASGLFLLAVACWFAYGAGWLGGDPVPLTR